MTRDPFDTHSLRDAVLAGWSGSPTRFREDANTEEDLRLGGYRDRLLVELAQNAADAATATGRPGRLRLSLVDGELRVANTGAPLDADGVAALASLRASAKRTGHGVGRFGVGFAAVLAVTDEPRVVSRTGGVAFSAERTRSELPDTLAGEVSRRGGAVPVLRLAWPVDGDEPPPPDGFDTEVRLPLRPDVDGPALLDGLASQVDDLLLSLAGLESVEVGDNRWSRTDSGLDAVEISSPSGTARWLLVRDSGVLSDDVVRTLGAESQERPQWTITWAVRTGVDGAPEPLDSDVLHAPTPTDERLSLPARLIATLPVEPSRRRLLPGPATDAVLGEAARRYPRLVELVSPEHRVRLVPAPGFPLSEVDDQLRGLVTVELRAAEWLPAAGGGTVAPARASVLDVVSDDLATLLADVLPGLAHADLAAPRHAKPLTSLGVTRIGPAELVAAITGVDRPATWWRRLYDALAVVAEAGAAAHEALAGLPVPLVDGRTMPGPRGALLLDDHELLDHLSHVDATGLRVVHPDAVHPLLERLGAVRAGPAELLESPALADAVERSVDDAESGLDVDGLVDSVLRIVRAAGVRAGEHPWLGALALRDTDGDWRRADELALPDSALLDVLAEDSPIGVLAKVTVTDWPADVLSSVGVLSGFAMVDDEDPTGPDHDLADEDEWWDSLATPPLRVLAVRDLDLVADDAWPTALRLLASEPATLTALRDEHGYTRWWLRRNALISGRSPAEWRLADATEITGLYDPVPDVGLDTELLRLVGVRTSLEIAGTVDADDLLARLADPRLSPSDGVIIRAHHALADAVRGGVVDPADIEPPDDVRTLAGTTSPASDCLVLDVPCQIEVIRPEHLITAGLDFVAAAHLAELLDLPLASEEIDAKIMSDGEPVEWASLSAVTAVADLMSIEPPRGSLTVHSGLTVRVGDRTHELAWWHDGRVTHCADTPGGLARAFAWTTGRWPDRHLIAAYLDEPEAVTFLD